MWPGEQDEAQTNRGCVGSQGMNVDKLTIALGSGTDYTDLSSTYHQCAAWCFVLQYVFL